MQAYDQHYRSKSTFRTWVDTGTHPHRNGNYAIVSISLKRHGQTPGDASADQMRAMADLAELYGHDELRISHEQNVILPHVHKSDLFALHSHLLATARSIPIAQEIAVHFDHLKQSHDIGELKIKISGCINACSHHHVGHIGILGLDRAGAENYQITLGGDATKTATVGDRAGPGFSAE